MGDSNNREKQETGIERVRNNKRSSAEFKKKPIGSYLFIRCNECSWENVQKKGKNRISEKNKLKLFEERNKVALGRFRGKLRVINSVVDVDTPVGPNLLDSGRHVSCSTNKCPVIMSSTPVVLHKYPFLVDRGSHPVPL